MQQTSVGFALAFVAAAAQAASMSTTITVTATATLSGSGATVSGTATLPNVYSGNGQFSATVPLTGSAVTASFTITVSSGNTLTGSVTMPASLLVGGGSGTGSGTITGGSGTYQSYSGTFPTLTGTGGISTTGSFTLSFFGAGTVNTSGGGTTVPTPTITNVLNNYSSILPGLPNYGISPGAIFVIYGSNLSTQPATPLQSSASPGLPKTLNGTSVSVTVKGTTATPAIYYTSPTQVAAVLPSTTPVGTGTITVTSGTQTSAAAPIQVVQSAFGLDTLLGTGTGPGVVEDANFNVLLPSDSATPGQSIILWGSGIGADTANDDNTYPQKQDDLTSALGLKVYIGGIQANVAYAGRSQYPGLDQINVTVPNNVALGCGVSVVVTAGTPLITSNVATIPVAASRGACSDPNIGISGTITLTVSGTFGSITNTIPPNATTPFKNGATFSASVTLPNSTPFFSDSSRIFIPTDGGGTYTNGGITVTASAHPCLVSPCGAGDVVFLNPSTTGGEDLFFEFDNLYTTGDFLQFTFNGPQLYTGSTSAPVIQLGTFLLSQNPAFSYTVRYRDNPRDMPPCCVNASVLSNITLVISSFP